MVYLNQIRAVQGAGAAALLSAVLLCSGPAYADLNKFEQAAGGEYARTTLIPR